MTVTVPMTAASEYAGAVDASPIDERLAESDRVVLELGSSTWRAVPTRRIGHWLDVARHSASFTTTCLTRVYSSIE